MPCAEEFKQHFEKMAGGAGMCSSCFLKTKYTYLTGSNYYCMRRSVFENEEDTPRRKEGKSVAYCETCFNETMIMKRRGSSEVILAFTRPAPFHHAVGNEDITSNKSHSSTGSTETNDV